MTAPQTTRVTQGAFDDDVIAFLMGQAPLEGVWFHDRHPTRKGAFWWRSVLRERSTARQAAEAEAGAREAALREALGGIDVWLSDTLSGRVQPDPATYKQWLIDGIVEARNRARTAVALAKPASEGEG